MTQTTPPPRTFPPNRRESTQSNFQHWTESSTSTVTDLDLPTGTQTVLVSVDGSSRDRVCHLIGEDNSNEERETPLCGSNGAFEQIAAIETDSEVNRVCDNCQTQQTGKPRTRPCPMCRQRIPVNRWPQHVRRCDQS